MSELALASPNRSKGALRAAIDLGYVGGAAADLFWGTMDSDEREHAADEEALEAALAETPRGAAAVAGIAVALLLLCWFAIYLFVFLPRGSVG